MCGRYRRWKEAQRIEELLGIASSGLDDFTPLYSITPGIKTWIARAQDRQPALHSYLGDLVPYWSKGPRKSPKPVNARAETAHEKPMFRKLIRERRCLITANGASLFEMPEKRAEIGR
jgi:putative SOS response-associated peptidase YedK